jgi:hypothetical protein
MVGQSIVAAAAFRRLDQLESWSAGTIARPTMASNLLKNEWHWITDRLQDSPSGARTGHTDAKLLHTRL